MNKKDKNERAELREEKKEVLALDVIAFEANEIRKQLHRIGETLDCQLRCICDQLKRLNEFVSAAKSLDLTQEGVTMGVIRGIAPGATETFDLSPLPVGSSLQAGNVPTYTQDNTTDVSPLSASADGLSFSITGAATFAPGATLNVTANAVSSNGSPLSKVFNIPLLPPAVVPATDLDLNQR